jgi:hypothetical protein
MDNIKKVKEDERIIEALAKNRLRNCLIQQIKIHSPAIGIML